MGSVGDNEGNKRRLPSWMMGAPASNLVRGEYKEDRVRGPVSEVALPKSKKRSRKIVKKSSIKDKEDGISEEASSPKLKTRSRKIVNRNHDEGDLEEANDSEEVYVPKSKRRMERIQKGTVHEDREADADNSCLLVKCDKTKRKRKTTLQVSDSDANNIGSEKFVRIDEPQRKKKGISNKVTAKEVSSSFTDNGRQLHVEDLIRIAEEYVKADNHKEQQQQHNVGACVPEDKFYDASAPFDGSTFSFDVTQTECSSAAIEANWTSSTSSEQVQNNSIFSNISRTGDPARDMLNILLGPLLSKPEDECKKTINSDDMPFDRPVQNQNLNRVAEDLAPAVKKKTSLKDKVAMFLD